MCCCAVWARGPRTRSRHSIPAASPWSWRRGSSRMACSSRTTGDGPMRFLRSTRRLSLVAVATIWRFSGSGRPCGRTCSIPALSSLSSPSSPAQTFSASACTCAGSRQLRFAVAVRSARLVHSDLFQLRRSDVSQHRPWRQCRSWRLADRHCRYRIASHPRHPVAPDGRSGRTVFVLIHMLWGVGLASMASSLCCSRIAFSFLTSDLTISRRCCGCHGRRRDQHQRRLDADPDRKRHAVPEFHAALHRWRDALMWVWATWWIPLLLLFGIWKHGVRHVPLEYTPMLWSLVFPLGMYALASLRLSLAADFPPLRAISSAMVWVALAAWVATAAGLVAACWQGFRDFERSSSR